MPVMIPPIAPGLKELEATMMDCGFAEVASELVDVDVFRVALGVPEVAVINVDTNVTGSEVKTAAVDVTDSAEDCSMLDVVADGIFTHPVDPTNTLVSSGRYGTQSQGRSSHPDIPTCRHDSSQFFKNTASFSYTCTLFS